jgi:hypothetical protein
MFVNGFTILLMMIALFCGIVWGVHAERQNAAARYKQQIRFRQAAYEATMRATEDAFKEEVVRWKRLVDSTLQHSYNVGFEDGQAKTRVKAGRK